MSFSLNIFWTFSISVHTYLSHLSYWLCSILFQIGWSRFCRDNKHQNLCGFTQLKLTYCACEVCCPCCEGSVLWLLLFHDAPSQCVSTIAAPEENVENLTWALKMLLKFQSPKQTASAYSASKGQKRIFLQWTQKENGSRHTGEPNNMYHIYHWKNIP